MRVLVAGPVEAVSAISEACMRPDVVCASAVRLSDAYECLRAGVDIAVCGIHLDGFYDLLGHMRGTEALRGVPFVAVRAANRIAGRFSAAIRIAALESGATAYFDMIAAIEQNGVPYAREQLQKIILDLGRGTL